MDGTESFAAGLVGVVLDGRYRLDALLGEGGMGSVFRAHHLAMDRKVAVKLLKPHLTNDDAALQRFAREARSTMKVDSPHAVKVLDFGVTPHRDYYMVLEYLDGRTVQRELDVDGPFAPARVIHIAKQALHALGAAHKSGLIHRDIKPENLLLMRSGDDPDAAKVLDFGVAKLMEGAARSAQSALAITQTGMVFGTPEFMSPEQACGQGLDPRSDLYSLAATMFAMLTGCGMYPAKSPIEWLTHHARTPPPRLADGMPELAGFPELDRLLQRCFAKRASDRPASAEEMSRMLDELAPTTSRKPGASGGRAAIRAAPSSYIAALPDPGATLLPDAQPAAAQSVAKLPRQSREAFAATMRADAPTTTGLIAQVHGRRRRGLLLAVGAVVIAGVVIAAIVVATQDKRPRGGAPVAGKQADPVHVAPSGSGIAAVASGSGSATGSGSGSALAAAGSGARSGSASGPGPHAPPRINAEAVKHLAAAEDAHRAGNRLKQMTEAQAALAADPRNVRARYLLADVLLLSGDLDRGCKYLRDLGRNPGALERARQAGCPTD